MKKIRLEPEALKVDSFHVATEGPARGTVVGREYGSQVEDGCVYPTMVYHSCEPHETRGEATCRCMYPDTDMIMCCSVQGCSGMC